MLSLMLLPVLFGINLASSHFALPVSPATMHSQLRYKLETRFIGRFHPSADSFSFSCQWPGSSVETVGMAPSIDVAFEPETENDRWQIEVDGIPTGILKLQKGANNYSIPLQGPGRKVVRLIKRSEAFQGTTKFLGFYSSQQFKSKPPAAPNRSIEIIGDSISAGFGVDGKTKDEKYSPETANAYLTYGMIAGRDLKADVTVIAWSGKKMWPDNDIPSIYDSILPSQTAPNTSPSWDFKKAQKPNAVVINLATNDFGKGIPDEKGWTSAYLAFVQRVRKNYPKAFIYLATGSMMSDTWPVGKNHLTTVKRYLDTVQSLSKDSRIKRVDFAVQDERDGIGSSYHPNAVTQRKMALVLEEKLKQDLKWR